MVDVMCQIIIKRWLMKDIINPNFESNVRYGWRGDCEWFYCVDVN